MKLLKIFLLLLLSYTIQARTNGEEKIEVKNNITTSNQGSEYKSSDRTCRVHRQGKFWLTVSNFGMYGNVGVTTDPETGKVAPQGIYPGSADATFNYVYSGAIWVGGYLANEDSTFSGPYVSLGSDGWQSYKTLFPAKFSDDADQPPYDVKKNITETSTAHSINYLGIDIFDPNASAEEQYTSWYTDKLTKAEHTDVAPDDLTDRKPLGVEIKQVSYSWSYEYAEDFILMDFTIYNKNSDFKAISNMFLGVYQDSDCGLTSAVSNSEDDLSGFKTTYDFVDPATGMVTPLDINCAWTADNDGREYTGKGDSKVEPLTGPLDGARGVVAVRVVRTPNPELKLSFNWWNSHGDEPYDYGPRWTSGVGGANGEHKDWAYDLTYAQKGYLDYDGADLIDDPNGLTEGTPQAAIGRYQVMSNGEFDYDQYSMKSSQTPQIVDGESHEWETWEAAGITPDDATDIANGYDTRFFMSFGPLGNLETDVPVKCLQNGVETTISKDITKLAYNDSLKLTIALIMGEDFHVTEQQSPVTVNPAFFNFKDLANNAIWASKVYDNPLYDTPVTIDGKTKRDGWYGEDVGKDGLFSAKTGEKCWWAGDTTYKQADEGENNGMLDNFTSEIAGGTSEDNFCKNGNTSIDTDDIGLSAVYGWQNPAGNESGEYVRFGYNNGILEAGDGLPDFKGPPAPPSPDLKIAYDGDDVIVKWASDNWAHTKSGADAESALNGAPENYKDPFSKLKDFEGYQVWISPTSNSSDASKMLEVDLIDYAYEDINRPGRYLPNDEANGLSIFPMTLEKRDQLISAGKESIDTLNTVFKIVNLNVNSDLAVEHLSSDPEKNNWAYSVDTETESGVKIYSMRIKNRLKANTFYVAVTSSDFGDPQSSTAPLTSNVSNNLTPVTPTLILESNDPVVVPNPYRVDSDYFDMGWERASSTGWSEHNRKIAFINLPKVCIIRIYTVAGDLVRTLTHNGAEEKNLGDYGTYWNLLNGNTQTVASGLYVYSVQDANDKDDVFIGKFAIIR